MTAIKTQLALKSIDNITTDASNSSFKVSTLYKIFAFNELFRVLREVTGFYLKLIKEDFLAVDK